MEVNLDKFILCVQENGEPIVSDDGKVYISNIDDNSIMQLMPNSEVKKHFGIEETNIEGDDATNDVQVVEEKSSSSTTWDTKAIIHLIELYKTNEELFKSSSVKRHKVWNIVAEGMKNEGYVYTNTQCENKFKYLKSRYTKKRDNMGDKGSGESPFKFEFFEQLDAIFGKKPNIVPQFFASSIQKNNRIEIENTQRIIENDEEPTEKRRKVEEKKKSWAEKEQNKIIEFLQTREEKKAEERERRHREKIKEAKETRIVYTEVMQKLIEKL